VTFATCVVGWCLKNAPSGNICKKRATLFLSQKKLLFKKKKKKQNQEKTVHGGSVW
jgi:hypothetical protein